MNNFDWNWAKEIDRTRIESLRNLDFLACNRNIIFIGAQRLGKTMISKNIVGNDVNRGYKGVSSSASRIVADLLHSSRKMEAAITPYPYHHSSLKRFPSWLKPVISLLRLNLFIFLSQRFLKGSSISKRN